MLTCDLARAWHLWPLASDRSRQEAQACRASGLRVRPPSFTFESYRVCRALAVALPENFKEPSRLFAQLSTQDGGVPV